MFFPFSVHYNIHERVGVARYSTFYLKRVPVIDIVLLFGG